MGRQQYINQCMEEAEKSNISFRHGAVVIKNNKIISSGHNKYSGKTPHHLRTVHAEMNAIMNCSSKLENATVYVIRLSAMNDNGMGQSCPCLKCTKFMKLHKIHKVVYSTPEGFESKFLDELS